MKKLAIFASGSGTNAENIISYFAKNKKIEVTAIYSNNKNAYVIQRAINHNINHVTFSKNEFYSTNKILNDLKNNQIDLVVLAGFMWLVPKNLIESFPNKIINIHPALLPMYGGKGMYGMHVHNAVVEAKEKETGITIHYVNENYDEGSIIFQAKCNVEAKDTPEDVANKVHELEYKYFPKVIEDLFCEL